MSYVPQNGTNKIYMKNKTSHSSSNGKIKKLMLLEYGKKILLWKICKK